MALNGGYTYREQLGADACGVTALAHLARRHPHSSEAEWRARLEGGEVTLDGRALQPDETLRVGAWLCWHRPPWQEPEVPLHFEVLHEDEAMLAVHKPSGLPTLPGGGFLEHTLLALVRARDPQARPLHRLGRATSGLLLFARSRAAGAALSTAWREHTVLKTYRALASGVAVPDLFDIRTPIGPVPFTPLGTLHAASAGGKPSHSVARVLERRADTTLFEVDIFTGRPHQIRIHLASVGHPLVGDPLYAPGGGPLPDLPGLPGDGGYLLHAERLRFTHPLTGAPLDLRAPIPAPLSVGFYDT